MSTNIKKPDPNAIEQIAMRTRASKTWKLPSGEFACETRVGGVAHWLDDSGILQDADTTLIGGKCESLPYKFTLHSSGIGFDFISREGGTVTLKLESIGGSPVVSPMPVTLDNRITFSEVSPGIDIVFFVLGDRVKSLRIVKMASAARSFEWLCETDATGASNVDDTLRGTDAARNQLELTTASVPVTSTSRRITETWTGRTTGTIGTDVPSASVTYPVAIDPTVTVKVDVTAGDGYEASSIGTWNSSSIVFGTNTGTDTYKPGWRFVGVNVPKNTTITSATITINATSVNAAGGVGTLYGELVANSLIFSNSHLPSAMTRTVAGTSVPAVGTTGLKTYTITSIIQEIVNQVGWVTNNALNLAIMTTGAIGTSDFTQFEDYEAAGIAEGLLAITYSSVVLPNKRHLYNKAVRRAASY